MKQEYAQSFIGSRLKHIPHSQLLYFNKNQLLLLAKRQTIRLDTILQTLVYTNIDDQKIIHSSHHLFLQLYLLLSQHNILVFNHGGELIKKFPNDRLFGCKYFYFVSMEDGYHGIPNNRQDFIAFVKGDHLYTAKAKVNYERAMINSKGICDFTFQIQPPELVESPQFIEGQKYLTDSHLLILWSSNQTYIYKLPQNWSQQFQRLYIYKRISKRQNRSLDYAVSLQIKIMAVAYESGVIKIYQLDWTKKYLLELKGHQSTCQSIYISHSNPYFLYSASTDSTVRIWNLRDYAQVYMLQLDVLIDEITFITEALLFINKNQLKGKSYLCQINTNLLDPIVNDNKGGHLVKIKCDKDWCVSIYSNNLVEFSSILNQERNLNNQKIEYPLKYGIVRDVFALSSDSYAIALEKGFSLIKFHKNEIRSQNFQLKKLVYNQSIVKAKEDDEFIELIHQKLLGTYLFNTISDWKNIPTSIKVTYVYFHQNAWLPMWDNSSQIKVSPLNTPASYCVLGTSKGQIYFVDIQKRTHFCTKVYLHTSQIVLIRLITPQPKNAKRCYFLSISSDKQLAIWKLDHEQLPTLLLSVNYNIQISYIEVYSCFLLVGEKQGEFSILKMQIVGESTLKMIKSSNVVGHLRAVICGDHMLYKSQNIFLSGGEDSTIKIWRGVQKYLIYQIKLFDIINTVNFIYQKLNMIVSHNEQISLIRQQKLKELMKVDSKLDYEQQINESNIQQIDGKQFFLRNILPDPPSPLKKSQHYKPSMRYQDYSRFLQRKMSRVQQPQNPVSSRAQQTPNLSKFPLTSAKLESIQKANTKVKKFHIFSSNNPSSLDIFLPRIFAKKSVSKNKILATSIKKDNSLIMELKDLKNRAFSNAGRYQQ